MRVSLISEKALRASADFISALTETPLTVTHLLMFPSICFYKSEFKAGGMMVEKCVNRWRFGYTLTRQCC